MLSVFTSALYCVGDDLIREGVARITGTEGETTVWINKATATVGGQTGQMWACDPYMPPIRDLLPLCRAFVVAGTPSWLDSPAGLLGYCVDAATPVWMIGVGTKQRGVAQLRELVEMDLLIVATVRDEQAAGTLREGGWDAPIFLDPAFHATYLGVPKTRDIVYCFAPGYHDEHAGLYAAHKDRVDLVVVHSPHEIAMCRDVLGVTPYFNHEYTAYKAIYGSCRCYLGGRLHGAIATIAQGGEAHVLYSAPKRDMLKRWEGRLPVSVEHPGDWRNVKPGLPRDGAGELIEADFAAHAAHVRARIG